LGSISAARKSKGSRSPTMGASSIAAASPAPRGNYDDSIRAVVDLVAAIEAAVKDSGTVGVGIPAPSRPRPA
jgi:fructokinase